MIPLSTDAIVEITIRTSSTYRPGDVFTNRLRYRATAPTDDTDIDEWIAGLNGANFQERWWDLVPDGYYCSHLQFTAVHPVEDIHEERGYSSANAVFEGTGGSVNMGGGFVPAMCAVVTRKTYMPGRAGIGHVYWGPLSESCYDSGYLDVTPATWPPLAPLLDFLGDPLTVQNVEFRPVVLPGTITGVESRNDVRANYFAPRIKQLESRRPGIGG